MPDMEMVWSTVRVSVTPTPEAMQLMSMTMETTRTETLPQPTLSYGRLPSVSGDAGAGAYTTPMADFPAVGALIYMDRYPGNGSHGLLEGWSITRNWTVEFVAGAAANMTTTRLFRMAEAAVRRIVGNRGEQDPDLDVPNYIEGFTFLARKANCVEGAVQIRGYPAPCFEFDGCLSQVESNIDPDDKPYSVKYKYPKVFPANMMLNGVEIEQGGMLSRPAPEPAFTIRFVVGKDKTPPVKIGKKTYGKAGFQDATTVMTYYKAFEGTVNNDTYKLGLIAGEARTWMITNVRGISRNGGITYEMAMTFQYREATWDQLLIFTDPYSGKPPPDMKKDVGYKMVKVAFEAPFPSFVFFDN